MILVLPLIYLILCFFFEQIWFHPAWCLGLLMIGGVYDIVKHIIEAIKWTGIKEVYQMVEECLEAKDESKDDR